jgi:hypothetical protein
VEKADTGVEKAKVVQVLHRHVIDHVGEVDKFGPIPDFRTVAVGKGVSATVVRRTRVAHGVAWKQVRGKREDVSAIWERVIESVVRIISTHVNNARSLRQREEHLVQQASFH